MLLWVASLLTLADTEDSTIYTTVMEGHFKFNMLPQVLYFYEEMKSAKLLPNGKTYYFLLNAYARLGEVQKMMTAFHAAVIVLQGCSLAD